MIVGRTEAEAKAKSTITAPYQPRGRADAVSAWNWDFIFALCARRSDPLPQERRDEIGSRGLLRLADPNRTWTVREICRIRWHRRMGPIWSAAEQIADELESWVRSDRYRRLQPLRRAHAGELYGLRRSGGAGLQRRGVLKREYREGTLREKLYGPGRAGHRRAIRPTRIRRAPLTPHRRRRW